MTIFQSVILGIVEGITEFLPVSSTGHLIIVSDYLKIATTDFTTTFSIAIQLGAILSVLFLYRDRLLRDRDVWLKIIYAFIPTAILGFIFYDYIKIILGDGLSITAWMLLVGGVVIILFEKFISPRFDFLNSVSNLPIRKSVIIGLAQSVAMIPGVSRSGASIIGGMSVGLSRKEAVEFSFLLALPTMLAATVFDVYQNWQVVLEDGNFRVLSVGFILAFILAIIAIKFLIRFVESHTLTAFGWYRVILGGLIILLFI